MLELAFGLKFGDDSERDNNGQHAHAEGDACCKPGTTCEPSAGSKPAAASAAGASSSSGAGGASAAAAEPEQMHVDDEDKEKRAKKAEAVKEKEAGNEAYKKKDFETALRHYNRALELDDTDISFLTNRAAVYFEQKDFERCMEDCDRALERGREVGVPPLLGCFYSPGVRLHVLG